MSRALFRSIPATVLCCCVFNAARRRRGVSKSEVHAYQSFVNELILSYERYPFIEKCDDYIYISHFFPNTKCQKRVNENLQQFREWLQKCIGQRQIVNNI